ncbi:hypothetical protein BFG60_3122 [Microcystis aeruginosa NIES-98]|nr:hypothetical protein BFG60_3122 [Microcystis aeruginosa NIES-98]
MRGKRYIADTVQNTLSRLLHLILTTPSKNVVIIAPGEGFT